MRMSNGAEMEAIAGVMADYFRALYEGDTALFAAIFHPDARLYTVAKDQPAGAETVTVIDLPAYLEIVANRQAPAAVSAPRLERILSIDVPTPVTAHVRVQERFFTRFFTDELTLVKANGSWKIVSKVWDFELLAD
ncbi:nuclear transport factor 2 family protein [Gellertiella hungarica]|uniref:Lumazine-binding protein n=1 Tax=Gellertiella hungarica TaxID=1572859 RepID=A0A7W6J743_9HYPH|nr:nuclear transport factor 2 family protein [Gellertiella hungarica]MBB4066030.1 hypothetical protein [Gellertiella hungarica]